jgi:hypothetical protein
MGEGNVTTPEVGFEFFGSPDSDDYFEHLTLVLCYCTRAVEEWPAFREHWKELGATPEQCDQVERNVCDIFREVRDTILRDVDAGRPPLADQPRLLQRYAHAHAFLALFALPGALPEYRGFFYRDFLGGAERPPQSRPSLEDFNIALWNASWNRREGAMPAEVTHKEAARNQLDHKGDGKLNSRRRRDPAAETELPDDVIDARTERRNRQSEPLTQEQEKRVVRELGAIGIRAGLKKRQVRFLKDMAFGEKSASDDPSATRAIRDRKRKKLESPIARFLGSLRPQED